MLYLKRKLQIWFMNYAEQNNIKLYELYSSILREWAKKHGFVCKHKPAYTDQYQVINGIEVVKCIHCGELITRWGYESLNETLNQRLRPEDMPEYNPLEPDVGKKESRILRR